MNTPRRILTGSISALLRKSPLLLAAASLTLAAPATFADTISTSVDLRLLSGLPNGNDLGALSLYNDGGGNVQRTFLNFDLSSYSGKSVTTDATLTLVAGIYGDYLTGVSLGAANSAWTQAGITWNNQPGLTAIAGATNPSGTFGSGPVTWTIPWYMLEKLATTGSGYNNGLGITSGVGSTQHFQSTVGGGPAPTLTFSAATAASGVWTGGNGNWTGTANWAGSTVAEAIDQTAIINGGTAVNITMDANRSVGALSFSGANHTISSGSGKLALNVTSGSPTITVQTGRIATIGATLVGIDGLTKMGNGTLTLSNANTYAGATTISSGTLQIAGAGSLGSGSYAGAISIGSGANLKYSSSTAQTFSGAISGAGSLTKDTSSSTLTLTTANTYTGATDISGGTLRLAGAPAASLWLDAAKTSSITTSGSAVSQWNDAAGGANFASQGNGAAQPTLTTDNAFAGPSKAMVDFGANGNSGKWMQFNSNLTDIRSAFWVLKGGAFLLGHTGAYDFHRGDPGYGNNATDNIWEGNNGYTSANIRNGQTYLNGTQVNGTTTALSGGYQMIDVVTTGNVQANNLANDRNIGGRQGGQQIGEVIIFNTALSTTERQQVETYLNYKWFGTGAGVGNLLPVTTAVTLSGGGTLDLSGVNYQTVASLASADSTSRVTLGGAAFTVGNASDTTFAGVLSDTGTLTKVGTGKLSLTNANTFSGLTTISNGTLELTGSAGSLAGAVTNNGALRLNRASALTVAGAIGGSGTLTQAGAGTSTLTGANTYTGATSLTNGRLQLNGSAAGTLTTSGITVNAGATLGFTTGAASTLTLPAAGITLGGGTVAFDIGGVGVKDTISTNSFTLTANSAFTFTPIGIPATGSTYTLVSSTNAIVTGGFTIAGQTIGKLSLTPVVNANTITLTPTLSQGVWNIATGGNWSNGNPNATGGNWLNYKPTVAGDAALFGSAIASAATVVVDTPHSVGFLAFNSASAYTIGTAGSSNLTLDNGGSGTLISVLSGAHTIAENVALASNVVINPASFATLSVTGNFTGPASVTHAGPGPLILTGANTHAGGTTLLGGFLTLGGASGTAVGTGGLTIANASGWPNSGGVELATNQTVGVVHFTGADYGAVHTQGHNLSTGGLDSTGGKGVVENRAANQPDPAGNATVFINVAPATTYSFDGYLRDGYDPTATTLAVVKNGTGTQVFTGNNISYTGGTTINAGILRTGSDTALGATGGSIAVTSGGSLDLNGRQLDGYTQNISIAGAGAVASLGALGNASATQNFNAIRGITLTADASIGGDGARWDIGRLDFNADPNSTVNHIIGGGFVLTKVGSSYLALLTGASNLAGFVVNGGTIAPHENTSFGAGPVTLNSGIIQPWAGLNVPNALILNGGTIQTDGFNDNYNGAIAVNAAATVNATNGVITFNGNVSGSGDLSKTGGNYLVLAGNNTQTGTLTVNGGHVRFSSSAGNATRGNVVMANGGSFLFMTAPNQFGANSGLAFSSAGHSEFALYGNDQTIASLASANQFAVVQNSHGAFGPASASSTLTINQSTDTFYNGYIRDNTGNDAFTLAISKSGAGTLTLDGAAYGNGAITYSGGTIINGGMIALNTGGQKGTLPDGGAVVINSGGTLRANATDALGYTNHNAGNGIFVNVGGVVTVAVGSRLSMDRDLSVTGGTITSVGTGDGTGSNYSLRDTYGSVMTFTSSVGGTPATLSAQGIGLNGTATFNVTNGPGAVDLNVTGTLKDNVVTGTLIKAGAGTMVLAAASTYTGTTTVNAGTLTMQDSYASGSFAIASGAVVELNRGSNLDYASGTTFSGAGTLRKTGAGEVKWGFSPGVFAMGSGALIDVQQGTFVGGSSANENWTANLADLNVAAGAIFHGVEANVRVDALTGAGTISSGYPGAGYTQFTFGVDNGSGTFNGVLTDGAAPANFVKEGTGTQTLASTNTYTGTTTVNAGTLIFTASQTLSSLIIADGAEVVFGDGLPFAPAPEKFGGPVLVPEPGTLGLLLIGALGMAARRRRSA